MNNQTMIISIKIFTFSILPSLII